MRIHSFVSINDWHYHFLKAYWTTLSEAEKDKEASLRDCFGVKIGAIILNEYSFLLNGAKQLINAVQFEKLELSNQILCENEMWV